MMRRVAIAAFVVVLSMPAAVLAQTTPFGKQMIGRWVASDKCAIAAQHDFPDFTPESLAKRDNRMKQCLAGQALPPRAPQSPGAASKP